MAYERDDVESIVSSALNAYSKKESSDLEHRVSGLEHLIEKHMEWEERTGEALRATLEKQQKLIERLFDKFDQSMANTTECKHNLEKEIADEYVKKSELELILEKRNQFNIKQIDAEKDNLNKCANALREEISENTKEITRYKTIIWTIGAVMAFVQVVISWAHKSGMLP